MGILSKLNPTPVWTYFEEVCRIPRLSRHEDKIRKYLLTFASQHRLQVKEDSAGNILMTRPPSKGLESVKTLVLQCHMDMVGEKEIGYKHNWASDPVIPYIDGDWVRAKGTTLGADDGIGLASQLAILTDPNLRSGRIECLFTVDEETGMTGALNLDTGFFEGRTLINLDSEDEGILFIGCAGGMDTTCSLSYDAEPVPENMVPLQISLTGLHGGHSGDEIHKGYGNSIKLMNRLLTELTELFDISISRFEGGNLRNAIPREAFADILVIKEQSENVKNHILNFQQLLNKEFSGIETELKLAVADTLLPEEVIDRHSQQSLLNSLECCPHGVIAWSKDMTDLVETSTNLAVVKFIPHNKVTVVTTQRSSIESSKHDAARMVSRCFEQEGFDSTGSGGYPGWKPDLNSEILGLTVNSYRRLFGKAPLVRAIHAGLECGIIYEKFNGIDMISFGPTIRGAHTTEERIEIKTVGMFWDLLTDIINNIVLRDS
jgi:dipeptidase D